jgi:hypothetical protein
MRGPEDQLPHERREEPDRRRRHHHQRPAPPGHDHGQHGLDGGRQADAVQDVAIAEHPDLLAAR